MPNTSKQADDSGRRLRRLASLTSAAKALMSEQAEQVSPSASETPSMNGSEHRPTSTAGSPDDASFDTAGHEQSSVESVWWTPSSNGMQTAGSPSSSGAVIDRMHTRSPDNSERHVGYLASPNRPVGSGAGKQQSPAGSPDGVGGPGHRSTPAAAAGLTKVNSETAAVVSAMNSLIAGERPGSPLGRYNSAERSDLLLLAMQQIQQLQQRVQAKKTGQSTAGGTPATKVPQTALQSTSSTPAAPTAVSRSPAAQAQQTVARPAAERPAARLPGQSAAAPSGSLQLEPLQLLSPAASAALNSAGSNAHKDDLHQSPTTKQAEASIASALAALQRGAPSLELWGASKDGVSKDRGSKDGGSKKPKSRRGSQLIIPAVVQATSSSPQRSSTSGTAKVPAQISPAASEPSPALVSQAYGSDLYKTSSSSGTPVNSSAVNVLSSSQAGTSLTRVGQPDSSLLASGLEQQSQHDTPQSPVYDADSSRLDVADTDHPDPASISRPGTSCESYCEPHSLESSQVFADSSHGHAAPAAPVVTVEETDYGGRQGPSCEWSPRPSRSEPVWAAAAAAAVAEVDRQSSPAPSAASPSPSPEPDMPAIDLAAAIAAATAALDRYGTLAAAAAAAQQQAAAAASSPGTGDNNPKGYMSDWSSSPQLVHGSPQPRTPAPSPALGGPGSVSPAAGAAVDSAASEHHKFSSPPRAARQSPDARQHQSRVLSEPSHEQSVHNYSSSSEAAVAADAATAAKIAALQTAADAVDQSMQEKKRAMAAAAALLATGGDSDRVQAGDSDAYVDTLQDLLQQLRQLEQTKQKLQTAIGKLQQGYSMSGSMASSTGLSVLGEMMYADSGVARTAQRSAPQVDVAAVGRSSLRKDSTTNSPLASPSPDSGSRRPQRTVSFKGFGSDSGGLPPPAQHTAEVLKPSGSSRSYHGSSLTRRRSRSPDREHIAAAAPAAGGDWDVPVEGYANIWSAQRSRATSTVGGSPPPSHGRSGGGSYRDAYALYTASKRSLAGGNAAALQPSPQSQGFNAADEGMLGEHTSMRDSHRRSSADEEQQQHRQQLQQQQDRLLASASRSLLLNKASSSIRSRGSGSVSSASTTSPTKIGANAVARQWQQNLRSPPRSAAGQQQQGHGNALQRSITPNRSFNARSGSTTPERSLTPQRSVTPERVNKGQIRSPWSTGAAAGAAAGGRYGKPGAVAAAGSSGSRKLGAQRLGAVQQFDRGSAAQYGVRQRSRTPTKSPGTTGPQATATAPASKAGSVYSDSPGSAMGGRSMAGHHAVDRYSTAVQYGTALQHSSRVPHQQQQQYQSSAKPASQHRQHHQQLPPAPPPQQQMSYPASAYGGDSSAQGSRGPSVAYPAEGFFLSREASTTAAGLASPRGSPRNSSSSDPKMLQLMQVLADFQAGEIREQDLRASLELVLMSKGGQQDIFMGPQLLQQVWQTGGVSPGGGVSPRSSLSPGRGMDNPLDKWQAWQQQQQQQQQSGGGASSTSPSRQSSRPNSMFGRQLSKMLSLVQDMSTSGGAGRSAGSHPERVHPSNFTVYSRG